MSDLIPLLVQETGLSEFDVRSIIRTAPSRYYTFQIAKRSGGVRLISQPARELKALQRVLLSRVVSNLPVHPAATAYRHGLSIAINAGMHKGTGPILKLDFADFFPSIRGVDWRNFCLNSKLFRFEEDIVISTNILFKKSSQSTVLRLAIGAPSSPGVSNALMYQFDLKVASAVAADKVVYSRYADDLTFSAKRTGFLNRVRRSVDQAIRAVEWPSLKINEEKTVVATRKFKRVVTGLVLTNDGHVSIGHERKRLIRATMHHAASGRLTPAEQMQLSGMLAFINDVEPEYLIRLRAKYGSALISDIKSARKLRWPN